MKLNYVSYFVFACVVVGLVMVGPVTSTSITEQPLDEYNNSSDSTHETPISCEDYFKFSGWWHHGESNIYVTHNGEPVEDVKVFMDGEYIGETDSDGEVEAPMPDGIRFELVAVQGERASAGDMLVGAFTFHQTDDCQTREGMAPVTEQSSTA